MAFRQGGAMRSTLIVSALALTAATAAFAQNGVYPDRPVSLVVGFSSGSSTDVAARIVAEAMSEPLGQRVIVDNRPGASSNISTQTVAGSEPDGYTLLAGTVANTINTAIATEVDFDFPGDFRPVTLIGAVPMILVVTPSLGVESVEELITMANERPGELLYGSPGTGTAPHLSAALFADAIGTELVHVPYGGTGQATQDLLGGRIHMMFAPASSVLSQIEAGNLLALATSLAERTEVAPDLPTLAEAGVEGFDTSVWFGIMTPAGASDAVVARLSEAANEALSSPALLANFAQQGIEPIGGTPEEFAAHIDREIASWSALASTVDLAD